MVDLRDYKAADGLEMLKRLGQDVITAESEQACRDCQGKDRAYSTFYDGELIVCSGVIHKTSYVGIAWMMPDTDPEKLRLIDPQVCRKTMLEIRERFGYRRLEATVRADFAVGHSYMKYLGFKVEGLMIACEPDGTNSFMYARTEWSS